MNTARTDRKPRTDLKRRTLKRSKYSMQRTFGHLKNKTLGAIGGVQGLGFDVIIRVLVAITVIIFIMFHAIYLKTGVPMFTYGLTMMFLPPLYFLWALLKIISVYLLKMDPAGFP